MSYIYWVLSLQKLFDAERKKLLCKELVFNLDPVLVVLLVIEFPTTWGANISTSHSHPSIHPSIHPSHLAENTLSELLQLNLIGNSE